MTMDKTEARRLAEPVIEAVVDCIAERRFEDIAKYAEFEDLSLADLTEEIEGFLELNELPYMDKFAVPCTFNPQYEYQQMQCYPYNDGSGFAVDYDLTTDGELNDLTLQMEFKYDEAGALVAKILDAHVL